MTADSGSMGRPGRQELERFLIEAHALSSYWIPAFGAVDRAALLPDLMWPFDMGTRTSAPVDRREDPDAWSEAADADVPIVTQWDDGAHTGRRPGRLSTSSSSMPSVVWSLLHDLAVEEGMNVLDVGTGTGETAGALTHRLGRNRVTTIEVDPGVSAHARDRLRGLGLLPETVVGDGFEGHPDGAPYDRVLATVGLREIPRAWITQSRPGGLILAPWGTHFSTGDAIVCLTVGNGVASGRFTRLVEFMKLRTQRAPRVSHDDYLAAGAFEAADISGTEITEPEFTTATYPALPLVLGLRVPHCVQTVADKRDGRRPVWFYSTSDPSWACVMFRDGEREATVWQFGPRRLWAEVSGAYRWWLDRDRPDVTRFGLTVTLDGHRAWLDDPEDSWRV
ncbi:methyltransferase domain-containing protein [Streptomyces sp. NPDC046887]|uniref:methyltransferase domain-containing protein n=1 Tax=Streptomyces sp. NPDC046887 TaxID=3155472 RepID=UPI0033F93C11